MLRIGRPSTISSFFIHRFSACSMCDTNSTGDIEDLNKTCGFARPMDDSPLASVDRFDHHIFLYTGHSNWQKKFPEGEQEPIKQAVLELKSAKKSLPYSLKATACDLTNDDDKFVSILAFPAKKVFKLDAGDVNEHIADVLAHLSHPDDETFTGEISDAPYEHYIFVCSDAATDKRCGYCGPKLVDAFEKELNASNLSGKVKVVKTNHVGGHKYAGNVIVYPAGDWFGYVTPDRVKDVISHTVTNYKKDGCDIIPDLWRGRLRMSKDQVKQKHSELKE